MNRNRGVRRRTHGRGASKVGVVLVIAGAAGIGRAQAIAAISMRSAARDVPPPGGEAQQADAEPVAAGITAATEPGSFWAGWKGSVEAGVNGSSGNSESLDIRMGFSARRTTPEQETSTDGSYTWATDGGEKSKSRGEFNLRNDWQFTDSPWFIFATGKAEYDEFQDWRWRFSALGGPGYALIRDEQTTLKLRGGLGASKELGGSSDEIVPELDLGVDFEHRLSERQRIYITSDAYPRVEDFAEFRTLTKAGWEILVDPETHLLLRLGIEHRHESQPGAGFKKNDLDYFAVMGWQF